ncbi:hypothetical protein D9M68_508230 [compost metagenome]
MELHHIHLRRGDDGFGRVGRQQRAVARPERRGALGQPGHCRFRMLLEKRRRVDALRRAHQRQRAIGEVRQHQAGDALVIAHQFDLGDAPGLVDDAFGVGDLDGGHAMRRHGGLDRLAPDRPGGAVGTQALEGGMADLALRRPVGKLDLCHQRWLYPPRHGGTAAAPAPAATRLVFERAVVDLQCRQPLVQLRGHLAVPAGADAADVAQFALATLIALVIETQVQPADFSLRPFPVREPADDEFLAQLALDLQPALRARGDVGRIRPLEHQAFQPEPAGRLEHLRGRRFEGLAEADPIAARADQRGKLFPALRQRQAAQVTAFPVRQVEGKEDNGLVAMPVDGVLQRIEVRHAVAQHDDLAIEPPLRDIELLDRRGQRAELAGPVIAVAGEQRRPGIVDPRQDAVAVELGFDDPAGAARQRGRRRGQLRRQLRRQRRARRVPDGVGRVFNPALPGFVQCAQRPGDDAVRQRGQYVELRQRPRPRVALLEEDPRFRLVARPGDADQLPAAGQLFAGQVEHQLAGCHARTRVADRRPRAAVPDNDRAGTVLFRWNLAFEIRIVERMVFDMDGHALFGRVVAGPLGHGPAQQHAVQFEPEIVVQAPRPMLLHHETQRLRLPPAPCAGGLGGDVEIPLFLVVLKAVRPLRSAAPGRCRPWVRCHKTSAPQPRLSRATKAPAIPV